MLFYISESNTKVHSLINGLKEKKNIKSNSMKVILFLNFIKPYNDSFKKKSDNRIFITDC